MKKISITEYKYVYLTQIHLTPLNYRGVDVGMRQWDSGLRPEGRPLKIPNLGKYIYSLLRTTFTFFQKFHNARIMDAAENSLNHIKPEGRQKSLALGRSFILYLLSWPLIFKPLATTHKSTTQTRMTDAILKEHKSNLVLETLPWPCCHSVSNIQHKAWYQHVELRFTDARGG